MENTVNPVRLYYRSLWLVALLLLGSTYVLPVQPWSWQTAQGSIQYGTHDVALFLAALLTVQGAIFWIFRRRSATFLPWLHGLHLALTLGMLATIYWLGHSQPMTAMLSPAEATRLRDFQQQLTQGSWVILAAQALFVLNILRALTARN